MRRLLRLFLWLLAMSAVPPLLMTIVSSRWERSMFWETYWVSGLFGSLIGLPASFILPRLMGRCGHMNSLRRVAIFAAALSGLTTIGTSAGVVLLVMIGYVPVSQFWHWMVRCYQWSLFLSFCIGVVTYAYAHLRYQIDASNEKLRAKELEEQRSRRVASESRLAALESRIHPHFLFNALNSVSSLIREDPVRAELLLERISALLRFSLYEPQSGLVTLEQELGMVRDYLEIESVRFGPRLRYSIASDPSVHGVQVPPLSVQTLVENSVKYAITNRRDGGEVRIAARLEEHSAIVTVEDSGQGFDVESIPVGHGLELLRSRLEARFGDAAGVEFVRGTGSMTVALRLPLAVTA